MTDTTISTALVPLFNDKAGLTLERVLATISPKRTATIVARKVTLPKKVEPSKADLEALTKLPELISNGVCPAERRSLTVEEIVSLLEEREQLDLVEKLIKARKDSQRTAAYNHHDVTLEGTEGFDPTAHDVDKDGHYVAPAVVVPPGRIKGFVRQFKTGSPVLRAERLEEQIDRHGEDFTREDFLACTTAVRVLDEAKATLHLRKKPSIAVAWAAATEYPAPTTAHTLGKDQ